MIRGGYATIVVADLDRAVRFYVETLGFKVRRQDGAHSAEVDGGDGLVLGLLPANANRPKPGTLGSISIGMEVNQPIANVVSVLENRGVVFHGPVRDDGAVKLAFFRDPDGNALYLVESNVRATSG